MTHSVEIEGEAIAGVREKRNVSASKLTTFGLGGSIRSLLEPVNIEGLCHLLAILAKRQTRFRILGAGSNIIVCDSGVDEPVIHLGAEFSGYHFRACEALSIDTLGGLLSKIGPDTSMYPELEGEENIRVLAFGGTSLMSLSRKMCSLGLSGLEFAAGIPGSLGGAALMNAGAHGSSVADVLGRVLVVSAEGAVRVIDRGELEFSYRCSGIEDGALVFGAEVMLLRRDKEEVLALRRQCLDYRKRTQPLTLPSAGSVFRNPPHEAFTGAQFEKAKNLGHVPAAAQMIEAVGLKGFDYGGVGFSEMHANWLVKKAGVAKAEDAIFLIREAQRRVYEAFGVSLELEIVVWQ